MSKCRFFRRAILVPNRDKLAALTQFLALMIFVDSAANAQVVVRQSIEGSNTQSVIIQGGTIVNIAREGDASINISSNLGPIQVRDARLEVLIQGSVVNIAEGRDRVSRINIGVNEALRTP